MVKILKFLIKFPDFLYHMNYLGCMQIKVMWLIFLKLTFFTHLNKRVSKEFALHLLEVFFSKLFKNQQI